MTRVHLLTEDGSQSSIAFNFPLRLHARLLAEHGLDVKLFDPSAGPEALACDVLFVNSNYFGAQWPGADDRVRQVLEDGRARAGRVVWFDTSASSGTAQFEVLPLVDLYCKAQVLVDRSDYLKEHHGDRVFTDYYFSRDGGRDEDGGCARSRRAPPRAISSGYGSRGARLSGTSACSPGATAASGATFRRFAATAPTSPLRRGGAAGRSHAGWASRTGARLSCITAS